MMQGERANRRLYVAEAVIIGLPTLAVSIPLLFLGFLGVVAWISDIATNGIRNDSIIIVLMMMLVVAGWAGLVSWAVLSGHYLSGGKEALRKVEAHWWLSLGIGCTAAAVVMAFRISQDGLDVLWASPVSWLMGPALILPAAHLAIVKFAR